MRPLIQVAVSVLILLTNTRPGLTQGTPVDEPLPQLSRLELDVRIDYDSEQVTGTATLTLTNTSTTSLAHVPLLLNRLMQIEAVRGDGGQRLIHQQRIESFEDFRKYQVNAAVVTLPVPLLPGATVRLAVDFTGYLVGYTEVGLLYVRDHVDREFTILREDALAFPVVGLPSLRISRAAPRAPFHYEVSATVPRNLVVATGGDEIERVARDSLVTWRYRSRGPAPYLIIAIAPYHVAEAGGLRVFHFPEDSVGARRILEASQRCTARLQQIFGPLEGPLALNVMEIPDGWGSQASLAGGIIQEAGAFRDRTQMRQLYHELSHLWNARDLDTSSPRWNEGLAMFLQDRLAHEIDGWDGGAAALQQTAVRLLDQCGGGQRCGHVPLRQYGSERMTDYSYLVGRLMFAALFHVLGDEVFDRALHRHYQARKAAGTTTDDIVRAFVDVGGEPAQRIFDDWLESTDWVGRLRSADSLQTVFDGYRERAPIGVPMRKAGLPMKGAPGMPPRESMNHLSIQCEHPICG